MNLTAISSNMVLKDMLCQLCGQVYKEPRMLACLHNYCTDCLEKYLEQTTKENIVICPQCNMETKLNGSISDVLPLNTFVMRNMSGYGLLHVEPVPTNTDNEDREFTEPSPSASMDEKEEMEARQPPTPEVTDSHIDEGEVNMAEQEGWSSSSYNATVDKLHEKYLQLQTKALQITYAVDSVNQSVEDWKENRCRVKEDIHHRSQNLQCLIRQLERKLIAETENQKYVDAFMEEVTNTKSKLQDTLKLTLYNIQSIRQLINDGQRDDIVNLGNAALEMKPSELCHKISLRLPEFKLEFTEDKNDQLLNEFGELNTIWKEKDLMPPSDGGNVETSRQKTILSDQHAEMTRSMSTDPNELHQVKQRQKVHVSPSSLSAKRNIHRQSMVETGSKHPMILTDAEKNIYLKYEDAKKSLEKRRRELAVKHMIGNKSRSQDESSTTADDGSAAEKALRSSGSNRSLRLNRVAESKFKMAGDLHASSESNILALNNNWRRCRHGSYKEESGQTHSENGSPIIAAKSSMARKKVTALLSQSQPLSRSNSFSSQTSEASVFGATTVSPDRSPTTPEKALTNDQWLETIPQEHRNEGDVLVNNAEHEQFKLMSRDKFNQVKENVKRRSDWWRSVSATN